ncbi:MAG: hypothetical protein ACI8XM_002270 [Haloarculaceae archaeon]|jgi:uncharacterized protein (TIGR04206 family)
MWVRSEYAGELAVLSTWLAALLPWSVTVFQPDVGQADLTAVWIRFLPGRFLYVFGLGFSEESPYRWVWEVPGFVATSGETLGSYVWLAGVAVFVVALGISIVYYLDEERAEAWRFDPVNLLGGLLAVAGGVLLVATGVYGLSQGGIVFPIGAIFQVGFGVLLLRVDRD